MTCDPGVDDAVALAVAAGRADGAVRAVVAGAGNVDAETAWRNAAGLARLLGLDVPVAMGSGTTVDGRPIRRAPGAHGADGLAGLSNRLTAPAGDRAPALVPGGRRTGSVAAVPGEGLVTGYVIATGPLTDVALALRDGRAVDRVVWMGGSFAPAAGDAAPAGGEFNAGVDPAAVELVLGAPVDLAIVPIEVTRRVALDGDVLARWSFGPPVARLCADLAARRPHHGGGPVVLHDPVAVVAALEPGRFRWDRRPLRCARGAGAGRGVLVPAGPLHSDAGTWPAIAVAVDAAAVRRRIVEAVLAAGPAT
ncbi:MAG TPA: nucleoside hydrolase [Acidimicrobiales bacterium]